MSPASWPSESLTVLKSSRSRNSTATFFAWRRAPTEGMLEPIDVERPVRQTGERIVERLAGQLLLEVLPLADVVHREDETLDVLLGRGLRRDEIDRDQLAVAAANLAVDVGGATRPQVRQQRDDAWRAFGRDEVVDVRSDQVVRRVPECPFDRGALVADDTGVIENEHKVGDVPQERFLAGLQLVLASFAMAGGAAEDEPGDDRHANHEDERPFDDVLGTAANDRGQRNVEKDDGRPGKEDVQGPLSAESAANPSGVGLRGHRCRLGAFGSSLNRSKVILRIPQMP